MDEGFKLETALPAHGNGLVVLTKDSDLLTKCYDTGMCVAAAMPRKPLSPSHRLRQTAEHLSVPLVATPGSFFIDSGDVSVHCLLRAIERNTTLSRLAPGDTAPADAWLAPPKTYVRRFIICPGAIHATYEIAERLTFTGPNFGLVMPPWQSKNGHKPHKYLRDAAYAGALKRYGKDLPEPVVDRLENELRIILDMEFSAYFLIVKDIVTRSPRTCGRGSGAASLVAYCLGITNVCPVKHNLYFERFLNPGRTDPPDIDVDFAWDEREGVLQAVLEKYRGYAAMVSNHVLFQPRMAIREVAKVYGLTDLEIGRVSKRLPRVWRTKESDTDLLESIKKQPETKFLDFPHPWPEIMEFARRIIGTPRYLSVHPGGVVITPGPINDYVPVEFAPKGVPILQWEKEGTEEAGLIKIDLLGNRSLGVIRDAVNNVRKNGIFFDESCWEPEEDLTTQQALASGRTMGCFYIESPAMRLLQQKAGVGDFEHLVIHSSIIRPAANEFIREYLCRLHGARWDPIHPLLADVLDETFGIMVYQEDVSRTAVSLAGFSHAEADGLRKVLSKKDRNHHLHDFHSRFAAGAKSRGVSDRQIADIWAMMMSFSGYSFCKPHSASYARVSFQAAYLKVHHPAEFIAGVISNQGGFYSTFAYVSEARRMGLAILPPDINESDIPWTGRGNAVRVGLVSIKGLDHKTRARIFSQRLHNPYTGIRDFFDRIHPDDTEARALIHCGALDAFTHNGSRTWLLWELAGWQKSKSAKSANLGIFDNTHDHPDVFPPPLPPENEHERLRREFAVLGFLCSRHPMVLYSDTLKNLQTVKITHLQRFIGKHVRVAAWMITGKVVRTKHGDPMEFITFEDETGIVETTFFPRVYRRFCHRLDQGRPFILSGRVEEDWGAITLTVEKIEPITYATPPE